LVRSTAPRERVVVPVFDAMLVVVVGPTDVVVLDALASLGATAAAVVLAPGDIGEVPGVVVAVIAGVEPVVAGAATGVVVAAGGSEVLTGAGGGVVAATVVVVVGLAAAGQSDAFKGGAARPSGGGGGS
jgi:hypothetical protein